MNLEPQDTKKWKPDFEVSISNNTKITENKTRQYKLKYKAKLDKTIKQIRVFCQT